MSQPTPRVCPRCGGEYRPGFERCADCGVELVPADSLPAAEKAAGFDLPRALERTGDTLARPWRDAQALAWTVVPALALLLAIGVLHRLLPYLYYLGPSVGELADRVVRSHLSRMLLPYVVLLVLAAAAALALARGHDFGRHLALMFVVADLALRSLWVRELVAARRFAAVGGALPFPWAELTIIGLPLLVELYLLVVLVKARRLANAPAAAPEAA